jgi:hypothetical protein
VYAWTSVHTNLARTATGCRELWQLAFGIGQALFNPQLHCGFLFLSDREYQVPGAEISQYRRFTHEGIFRGVVVRRGNLIFVYIGDSWWCRFDLETLDAAALEFAARETEALADGEEVES